MPATPPTIERLKQSRIRATVTFTVEEVAKAEEQALREMGQSIMIKGFRPGHAPIATVRERVTKEALTEQTIRGLMKTALPALIEEHKIVPVIPPKVEVIGREPMVLAILFVERPEVTVKNADTLAPAKKEITVDPKDVERVIEGLRREHRRKQEVDRSTKEGDDVTIDFSATDADGKEIAGLRGTDEEVTIGSQTFLPGFEDALQGTKKGEEKTFTLTLPEKFPVEALRTKPASFHVTVKKVEENELPELTDAFVQKVFGQPTAEALRTRVTSSIRMQEEQHDRMERERKLLEEIRKRTTVDLAEELLETEVGDMVHEWSTRLERQGTTIAEALRKEGKTVEQAEQELKTQALERWKLRLGLQKLIEMKAIHVTEEEVEQAFAQALQQMPKDRQEDAKKEWQQRGAAYQELRWRTLVEKAIDALLA